LRTLSARSHEDVLVQVRAAGVNPGEAAIRRGAFDAQMPADFPSGQGSDFAGVVRTVGANVTGVSEGEEVLGWSERRSSQAQYVVVPARQVVHKPAALSWEVAGSLYVVGVTAQVAVDAVAATESDTVVVSAASGGVGTIVVQLLRLRGATVVGIASERNHEWLRSVGVLPVAYEDGLEERIRDAAPTGVDAFIDLYGPDYVELALRLGVAPGRIETIISFGAAKEHGTKALGSQDSAHPAAALARIAELVAAGTVEVPIAAAYPMSQVRDAYERVEDRHTRGKIVLLPAAAHELDGQG
jgi:NADPH:quinone reductase-like Zn-dependent oxidoreductase